MVSILISVYNQDPGHLVQDLSSQLEDSDYQYEILIGNDCSESKFMPLLSKLEKLPGVSCVNSNENIGRSRIRNKLAGIARYPYLLFIDGDASVQSDNFIKEYLSKAEKGKVLCGGTAYLSEPPVKKEELLRWKYGVSREALTAKLRALKPYGSFSSFNFLIPAEDFDKIRFNEKISRYGHEDTLFGIELENRNIAIKHIDNQLIHNGLDSSVVFLEKTREAVLSLLELLEVHDHKENLYKHIKLLYRYRRMRKWGGHYLISLMSILAGKFIIRNLSGSNPSLLFLDLYKLIILNDNQT